MGTHLIGLRKKSFPMNTNMAGFKKVLKVFSILVPLMKVANSVERVKINKYYHTYSVDEMYRLQHFVYNVMFIFSSI